MVEYLHFIASEDGGVFQRGSARHVDVATIRDPTRQVGHLQVQGRDTSRRCRLTGTRHTTSLPFTRVQCPLCGYRCCYPSVSFYLHRFKPLFLFRR
jgi:hypothetical protein